MYNDHIMQNNTKTPAPLATEICFTAKSLAELNQLRQAIENGTLYKTVRFGDRSPSTMDPKGGYKEGETITLKVKRPEGIFDTIKKRFL